jgi:Family of unknown function (DUF6236)
MSDKRGIVVSQPTRFLANGHVSFGGDLDRQELRTYLLFWDSLDYPDNNVINVEASPDVEFLRKAGVLQRTRVTFEVGDTSSLWRARLATFRMLDEREPGQWSLASGPRSISFEATDLEQDRGVLVKLVRAVPVPDRDVPLNDILEFRTKRRDELLALRHHLEDVYQKIIAAGDGALALNTEIERLRSAIADHLKAGKEWPLTFRLADLRGDLNVVPGVLAALRAFEAGFGPLGILAAGVGAAILEVKAGPSLRRRAPSATPFEYISSYHDVLF